MLRWSGTGLCVLAVIGVALAAVAIVGVPLVTAWARVPSTEARIGRRGREYFENYFRKDAILPDYIAALTRVAEQGRAGGLDE